MFKCFAKRIASLSILLSATGLSTPVRGISLASVKQRNNCLLGFKPSLIRILTDQDGKELERKIIPYMPPDKYAYRYEWDGRNVIDRGLQDIGNLNLALEFYTRSEEALNIAENNLRRVKEALNQANERAKNAEKLMRKAEKNAEDVDDFEMEREYEQELGKPMMETVRFRK